MKEKIHFEYAEGATPIYDYSGIIPNWIKTQKDLNRAEAENILIAQKKYLSTPIPNPIKWLAPNALKKIHKVMYGNVWEWAGEYRNEITSIGIKPYMIPSQISELCKEVSYWLTNPVELTFIEQAARIHHKMVFIHPFENGNGRFSRLVADRFLMFWGLQNPEWPIQLYNNGTARSEYINSLKKADKGDYSYLVNFMQNLGIKDPSLSEFLGFATYTNKLNNQQRLAIVKALLRIGNPVNETKNNGHHPLHIAIKKGYEDIALLLINQKADLQFKDRSGYDCFEMAIVTGNLKLAHAIHKAGYAYLRDLPPRLKLIPHYAKLIQFELEIS